MLRKNVKVRSSPVPNRVPHHRDLRWAEVEFDCLRRHQKAVSVQSHSQTSLTHQYQLCRKLGYRIRYGDYRLTEKLWFDLRHRLSPPNRPHRLCDLPMSMLNGYRNCFPWYEAAAVWSWSASSAEDKEFVDLFLRSRICLYGMQRDIFSCIVPIVWVNEWASELVSTWWQRATLLPAVENRTSVEPVITIWDIQDLQELHKNSIYVYQLTEMSHLQGLWFVHITPQTSYKWRKRPCV